TLSCGIDSDNREIPRIIVDHVRSLRAHETDDSIVICATFRIERRLQQHTLVMCGAGSHIGGLRQQPYGNAERTVGEMNAAPDVFPFLDRVGKILRQDFSAADGHVHIAATDGDVEGVVLQRSNRTRNCRINSQHVLARFEYLRGQRPHCAEAVIAALKRCATQNRSFSAVCAIQNESSSAAAKSSALSWRDSSLGSPTNGPRTGGTPAPTSHQLDCR